MNSIAVCNILNNHLAPIPVCSTCLHQNTPVTQQSSQHHSVHSSLLISPICLYPLNNCPQLVPILLDLWCNNKCYALESGQHSVTSRDLPLTSVARHQPTLSSLFHWDPSSTVGKRRKPPSSSRGSKKKKLAMWTHTFVCLANVNQEMIPDGEERAELQIVGLGEKCVTLSVMLRKYMTNYYSNFQSFPSLGGLSYCVYPREARI